MSSDNEKKPARTAMKPKKVAATSTSKKNAPKAAAAPKKTAPKKAVVPKAKTAAKTAAKAGIPEVAKPQPTHAEIAYRAYLIFLERDGGHGHHESDWLRAERELLGL